MNIAATNWVTIRAVPGHSAAIGAKLGPMLEQLRSTEGCLSYIAAQSPHDPDLWSVVGSWSDHVQMTAHFDNHALNTYGQLLEASIIQSIGFDCLVVANQGQA